jgi:hypothetical protein
MAWGLKEYTCNGQIKNCLSEGAFDRERTRRERGLCAKSVSQRVRCEKKQPYALGIPPFHIQNFIVLQPTDMPLLAFKKIFLVAPFIG